MLFHRRDDALGGLLDFLIAAAHPGLARRHLRFMPRRGLDVPGVVFHAAVLRVGLQFRFQLVAEIGQPRREPGVELVREPLAEPEDFLDLQHLVIFSSGSNVRLGTMKCRCRS